ncbi:MAG: hypothetical protein QM731_09110 [Chitinophagaceae bacterium]
MKISRLFSFLLLLCAAVHGQSPTQRSLVPQNGKISFTWKGDSMRHEWEPYSAILLPVSLPGCKDRFYMQFDLGSPYSFFYSRPLEAIRRAYPKTAIDTGAKTYNGIFSLGKMKIIATGMPVQLFGDSVLDHSKDHRTIIGTIGSDIINNKVVMINYPEQALVLADTVAPALASVNFMYMQGRVLLPATIKNKQTLLYFDTGSSAFELLIDRATWQQLAAANATPVRYPVQSWNNTMYANTIATNDSISIAASQLPLHQVSYMEGASTAQINQMMKMGIGGMTGNKLFIRHTLVLDTRNKKFGIIAGSK